MKKSHLKVLVKTLTETQIQMKSAHRLTEQVLNNKILYYKEKLEEAKKQSDMWRDSYSTYTDKLESAVKAKDHYYGRVKTLKSSLERQAEEKAKLQRKVVELKNQINNML